MANNGTTRQERIAELREWLEELELAAQDAWTNSELRSLRSERDQYRAELAQLETEAADAMLSAREGK